METAAQDIVKEAQKGRQEAIDSLEALGYAINPITGKIEATLQAKTAQAQEQRAIAQEQRLAATQAEQVRQFDISQTMTQARFEATEARLAAQNELDAAQQVLNNAVTLDQRRIAQEQLEISQENLAIAQRKLELEIEKEKTPDPSKITGPQDLSPLAKAVYDRTIKLTDITPTQRAQIAPELNAVGYTNLLKEEDKQALTFISGQMANVMNAWKAVPSSCTGSIQGRYNILCEQDAAVVKFNTSVGVVSQALANLMENGRLTDTDRAFYLSLMPNRIISNPIAAQGAADEMQRLLKEKLNTDTNTIETDIINATQADVDYINSLGY